MEMQTHMSAGLSCGGSWSWHFVCRAVGMQGALSAATILQYISVVLERCTNAGIGLVCIAVDSSQSLRALLCLHQEEATLDYARFSRARTSSFAPFPHLPGRRVVWFVENPELLTLNTYGLCVFLELVGDMIRRCKFSWSTGLIPPCGAYATAAWLPLCWASSSCSSGRAVNLDRGDGSSVFA